MVMVSSFPFGWVRNINSDNWQLLWNSINKDFYVKSARSKKTYKLASVDNWIEAKKLADKVKYSPTDYIQQY